MFLKGLIERDGTDFSLSATYRVKGDPFYLLSGALVENRKLEDVCLGCLCEYFCTDKVRPRDQKGLLDFAVSTLDLLLDLEPWLHWVKIERKPTDYALQDRIAVDAKTRRL